MWAEGDDGGAPWCVGTCEARGKGRGGPVCRPLGRGLRAGKGTRDPARKSLVLKRSFLPWGAEDRFFPSSQACSASLPAGRRGVT